VITYLTASVAVAQNTLTKARAALAAAQAAEVTDGIRQVETLLIADECARHVATTE
jgi:hypothetical protein